MQAPALVFLVLSAGSPCGRGARVAGADLSDLGFEGTGDELGNTGIAQSLSDFGFEGTGDDLGNTGIAQSTLQRSSESSSAAARNTSADSSSMELPNNLLGSCPKDSHGMDIEGQYCDSEQLTKCCASKCRYRTTMRQSTFGSSYPVEVPKAVVDKLFEEGLHPSVACCRLNVYLAADGVWSCRKEAMALNEEIEQISRGPLAHRWESFARAIMSMYDSVSKLESRFEWLPVLNKAPLTKGQIKAKPLVMMIGGYSTGKTSFIKSLLGKEYRGSHIGVEPTTDKFTYVSYGKEEIITPGEIVSVDSEKGFEGLTQFGNGFLHSFRESRVDSEVLNNFAILDTPGVLSGEKQNNRDYDFEKVIAWFADRADMIFLAFDIHKIDISDELKSVIRCVGANQHKFRILLNKADSLEPATLMRSYGGLMYGLGRVFHTPELKRIYVGSFRDEPYDSRSAILHSIFESDKKLLDDDMKHLSAESSKQKVNSFIARVKLQKAFATLLDYLRQQMPAMWGGEKKKQELITSLPSIYDKIDGANGISKGDLPDATIMQEMLVHLDFGTINTLKAVWIERADAVLARMSDLSAAAVAAFS